MTKFTEGMASQGGQVVQTASEERLLREDFYIQLYKETYKEWQGARRQYKVGDTGPGGGVVFAVEGNTGMEVSRLLGIYTWNDAINIARNYRGSGMNDWYLPSIDELSLIYENLQKAGAINLGRSQYWSSSPSESFYVRDGATFQDFDNGTKVYGSGKRSTLSVRAVRAF